MWKKMSEYFWRKHNQELNINWACTPQGLIKLSLFFLSVLLVWSIQMCLRLFTCDIHGSCQSSQKCTSHQIHPKGQHSEKLQTPQEFQVSMLNVLGFWNNVLLDRWEQSGDGNAQPHICCAISVQTGKHSGGRVMIWAACSLWVNHELLCVPKSSEGKC